MRVVSPLWARVIGDSHRVVTVVDSYLRGLPLRQGIPISSGAVTWDDTGYLKKGLRLSVPARDGLLDLDPGLGPDSPLAAYGQRLRVRTGVELPNGETELLDLGWFLVSGWDFNEASGSIDVTAQDLARFISDDRLFVPASPPPGATFASEFTRLVNGIMPVSVEGLVDRPISNAIVWGREREKQLDDLCDAWPARWYVNDAGTVVVTKPYGPVNQSTAPTFTVTDGVRGTVTDRARSGERGRLYNAVVVNGKTDDKGWAPFAYAQITDSTSPISVRGAYGRAVRFYASELITTNAQALATAESLLLKYSAIGRQESVTCVPNPAIQLGDVGKVITTEGYSYVGRVTGIGLPLTATGAMELTLSTLPRDTEEGSSRANSGPGIESGTTAYGW